MVTFVLLAVVWLSQSLRFIELIVNQGLGIGGFLTISSLLLPSFLGLILPITTFIAVSIVYIRLHNDRELVVMRAGGLGPLRIMAPALLVAALMSGVLYSINLYFLPAGYAQFKSMQHELRNDLAGLIVREGSFNTMSDDLTVYVRQRDSAGTLQGLLLHDARNPSLPVTMMAERGTLVRTNEGPRFVLEEGNRQQYDRTTGQLTTLYFDRYVLDMENFTETSPGERWPEPNERFLSELLYPDPDSPGDVANYDKLIAVGHDRLSWPLYSIAYAALAASIVLIGAFNRRGVRRTASLVTLSFMGCFFGALSLSSSATSNLSLVPLMYGMPLLIFCLPLFLVYTVDGARKLKS